MVTASLFQFVTRHRRVTALRHNSASQHTRPAHQSQQGELRHDVPSESPEPSSPSQEYSVKRILVPTDFSPRDTKAVQQAVAMARVFDARLTLLHVIDINDPAWLKFAGSSGAFMRQLRTKAHSEMDRLRASLSGESIEVESLITEGLPPEEIVQRTHDADLVIMGRPRSQRWWRLFSKKTAQRVIDQAECGVLVVQE
jgi:nucleotide-binding universal stress UspA family protein